MYSSDKERFEAIYAGQRAIDSLDLALEKLDKAKGWGLFDILGGGLISSLAKKNRIEEANQAIEKAKRDLIIFNNELADVDLVDDLRVDVDGILGTADWLFDNTIVDVIVQLKISKSIENIESAIDKIEQIIDILEG